MREQVDPLKRERARGTSLTPPGKNGRRIRSRAVSRATYRVRLSEPPSHVP